MNSRLTPTAEEIKRLREDTGYGMEQCKRILDKCLILNAITIDIKDQQTRRILMAILERT